jgi:hypothetical protein
MGSLHGGSTIFPKLIRGSSGATPLMLAVINGMVFIGCQLDLQYHLYKFLIVFNLLFCCILVGHGICLE